MNNLEKFKFNIEKRLKSKNIDKNEVNIIFCEALNCSRGDLLFKNDISIKDKSKIRRIAIKRLSGMPIQKIFKKTYFYDIELKINNDVLCPRPETELLVREAIKILQENQFNSVLDLCTGSGAIAIAIKKNANCFLTASDISKKALILAKCNAKKYNLNIKFIKSDMFDKIKEKFDIIVSNPPYVQTSMCKKLDVEVRDYDPLLSLDGGKDGLDFYRIIAKNAKEYLNKNGKVLLEIGQHQAKKICCLLSKNGFTCVVKKDYNNRDRFVIGELKN